MRLQAPHLIACASIALVVLCGYAVVLLQQQLLLLNVRNCALDAPQFLEKKDRVVTQYHFSRTRYTCIAETRVIGPGTTLEAPDRTTSYLVYDVYTNSLLISYIAHEKGGVVVFNQSHNYLLYPGETAFEDLAYYESIVDSLFEE